MNTKSTTHGLADAFLGFLPFLQEGEEIATDGVTLGPVLCQEHLKYSFLSKLRRLPFDPVTNAREDKLILIK